MSIICKTLLGLSSTMTVMCTNTPDGVSPQGNMDQTVEKPRVIITTDLGADPDDEQSLVHVLLTADLVDIEGIVGVTSCWRQKQSLQNMNKLWLPILEAYRTAYPNLLVHSKGFPSPDHLASISKLGQSGFGMADVGEGKDSPGSELIIEAVDRDDDRPVWVNFWGGGNTLAQALWKVSNTRDDAQIRSFVAKLRVYDILGQDDAGAWITKNFPDLLYIRCTGVYSWQPNDEWTRQNVQNHGPLGAAYPDRKWAFEGDTPAWLYLLPNGLNSPENPSWGGWGGRFVEKSGIRGMTGGAKYDEEQYDPYFTLSDADGGSAIGRWKEGIHANLAARAQWAITPSYKKANHHPCAIVNMDTSISPLMITTKAGIPVELDASASTDPDGDTLSFEWSYYREASTYRGDILIANSRAPIAKVLIPDDAQGSTLHIILEVSDDGQPKLISYRRIIINVEDND